MCGCGVCAELVWGVCRASVGVCAELELVWGVCGASVGCKLLLLMAVNYYCLWL
jgi:hypothetical protein